ncbi:uncharacterized protein LOC123676731 isoform X2 [Harmonia axyridis]|uniref:uncharacterized protein LOC123676731 isoform X2 n=1 Tax=Harmonia axyridis TaxID=115357 RepID=UPI001E276DB4|nr:uncharacterized protein LOC123676731 isoform X2 [Harmonia axyridis]
MSKRNGHLPDETHDDGEENSKPKKEKDKGLQSEKKAPKSENTKKLEKRIPLKSQENFGSTSTKDSTSTTNGNAAGPSTNGASAVRQTSSKTEKKEIKSNKNCNRKESGKQTSNRGLVLADFFPKTYSDSVRSGQQRRQPSTNGASSDRLSTSLHEQKETNSKPNNSNPNGGRPIPKTEPMMVNLQSSGCCSARRSDSMQGINTSVTSTEGACSARLSSSLPDRSEINSIAERLHVLGDFFQYSSTPRAGPLLGHFRRPSANYASVLRQNSSLAEKKEINPKQTEGRPNPGRPSFLRDFLQSSCSSSVARSDSTQKTNSVVAGGANGIFTRRQDFSSFNSLPKIKLNSYQIKTEDEGNHGNDDTRCFILSTLASHNRSKVQCVLCEEYLLVFDRYPLVDGTFFLSPRQHSKSCIEVKVEGRTQFLTCVCMGCLEGNPGRQICCRFCNNRWDGSSLVLGTMYSYDIFAAMPCCTERIKCNSCFKPVLHPAQRLNYFSDYSHMVPCPHCRTLDTHFVKSLQYCFIQNSVRPFSRWP